jgi:3-oxoacyl-[acyl-carrier-protein] synthase-1
VSPDALEACVRRIGEAMPFEIQRGASGAFNDSHSSGLIALAHAVELIDRGVAGCCLVGGVDSWIDIDHLTWLEGDRRLKSPDVPAGLVPGEAASFVLVARADVANEYSLKPLASVLALSFAPESAPWYTGNPTTGHAATAVFRTALDAANVSGVSTVADLNGESWRVDEWVLAYLRTGDRHSHPLHLEHPADCWGDVGAATGVLLTSFVASEFRRRPDAGAVLISTASDISPLRAACVLAPYPEHVS